MTELLLQLVLYTYPLWALTAFAVSLAYFVEYFFMEPDKKLLIWGVVFLGWSVAFFGAGLLIAGIINRETITPIIQSVWIVTYPFFAIVAAIKCWRVWLFLQKFEGHKGRRP